MKDKISNFPIMFFAVILGLGGLGVAYAKLNEIFELSQMVGMLIKYFVTAIFALICLLYGAKIMINFAAVKAEFAHVIKINFFAAFPISMLLLAILWRDTPAIYALFFYGGSAILTFLTFWVVSFWINRNLEIKHSNPAWFIPIVGNLIVVIAANATKMWLWYYFSLAIFFYVVLFAIIFYRILFHDQLPQKFMPTLFILIAPPAIGFLDIVKLTGEMGVFAMILLNLGLFFTFLVIFMYKNFVKLKFFLSWWAFTFPTAAICVAVLRAYEISRNDIFAIFGIVFFAILCVMIAIIGTATIKNILRGEICKPEM